jgi:hypothetical protein
MKVYVLKESDFEVLLDKLKLESFKKTEFISDPTKKNEIEQIHSAFHYYVSRWIGEMKKDG